MKELTKASFYPVESHQVRTDDQTGSKYWAVKAQKLMFTYFEVPPNKYFESHSHESEQMTYVLTGKLCFNVSGEVYSVRPGELISIPSDVRHSVWTETEGATAVDAWSPVNEKY
jgi:quercetin dioxygenase-like cupin family protein